MADREFLTQELKEDAKEAFSAFMRGAKKACVYSLLVLNMNGVTPKEEAKLETVKKEYKEALVTQVNLEDRLDQRDNIYETIPFMPYFNQSSEERANNTYLALSEDVSSENIPLQFMMDKVGVTSEDVQTLISENPEVLSQIIPGRTNKALAKSSDKVKGGGDGHCLSGVQKIFDNAGLLGILSGSTSQWPEKIGGCRSNSACNAYVPLEKSGKFITVSIDNKAYNTSTWSNENQEMRDFVRNFPAGTIIITDNKITDENQDRNYRELQKIYGTGGGMHGHITVKSNIGSYNSDIIEASGPNFSRYGEQVFISLPKDIQFSPEQAKQLIAISQKRQENILMVSKASNKYINYLNFVQNAAEKG
jgi:hypothetical protein